MPKPHCVVCLVVQYSRFCGPGGRLCPPFSPQPPVVVSACIWVTLWPSLPPAGSTTWAFQADARLNRPSPHLRVWSVRVGPLVRLPLPSNCVQAAIETGMKVVPLPGPCALVTALVASGLPTDGFTFCGFLPPKQGAWLGGRGPLCLCILACQRRGSPFAVSHHLRKVFGLQY